MNVSRLLQVLEENEVKLLYLNVCLLDFSS
jgi:hypothetical protein